MNKISHFRVTEQILKHVPGLHQKQKKWILFGCMLHYIEDFFTYPHNEMFHGSLREHARYEGKLYWHLVRTTNLAEGLNDTHRFMVQTLSTKLGELHDKYLNTQPGIQTDLTHIMEVVGITSAVLLPNIRTDRAAEVEGLRLGTVLNLPTAQ